MEMNEVLQELDTTLEGLSSEEAHRRLIKYGFNEIKTKKKSPLVLFGKQFANFLIAILLVAITISLFLGEVIDAIAIAVIVFLMGVMGFLQEYKAERTIEALKKLSSPRCSVLRDGRVVDIPASHVVPGDVLLLREGDKIVADARLIEVESLEIDESPLTGESTPVEKNPDVLLPSETPVSDRVNMVFAGTYVVKGRGKAIVVNTGDSTELGRIARAIVESGEEKTILERELDYFAKRIGILVIAIAVLIFLIGLLEEPESIIRVFMVAVALAVAAIPEGLPAIATAILAIGAYRMAKKNALVRRLAAVESLGSVDIICTDKTGTITKGEMTVKLVRTLDAKYEVEGSGYEPYGEVKGMSDSDLSLLYKAIAAHTAIDVSLYVENNVWRVKGSPTEGAALILAYKALGEKGVAESVEELPIIKTYPFDRFRKRKTTIHRAGVKYLVISTGAPEVLLEVSNRVRVGGVEKQLDADLKKKVLGIIEELASQGYRTLGVTYKYMDNYDDEKVENIEKDLVFYAILGMIDPPRDGVKEAVEMARRAGVKTIMITGDHKLTAIAIAKMIGLDIEEGIVLEGRELDSMSDEELSRVIDKTIVFARVTPEHKARIVRILKKKGYRVAMTGDGINDAPALKVADVGVAMGIKGTEVAKEASQLVLLDDNYVTIVEAIREGRVIFENIKKPINYLLSANMGEVITILASQLLFKKSILEPIHLLWINVVTDALPAIALGIEPPEPGIMDKPPRSVGERLINARKLIYYVVMGSLIAVAAMLAFINSHGEGLVVAETAVFTTIVLTEFGRSMASRSENIPLWKLKRNNWLIFALIASLGLQLIVLYTPLSQIFHTTLLPPELWLYGLAASLTIWLLDEIRKIIRIRI